MTVHMHWKIRTTFEIKPTSCSTDSIQNMYCDSFFSEPQMKVVYNRRLEVLMCYNTKAFYVYTFSCSGKKQNVSYHFDFLRDLT